MELEQQLRAMFGFTSFRPGQREVLEAIMAGRDVVALMPTGAGKSLCYQFPAFAREGLTLVISPLIALMKDQIDFLAIHHPEGYAAIDSSLTRSARRTHIKRMIEGRYRILFVAPERFRGREFVAALKRCRVSLLVVDEAHCISEWGHDFRPDYLHLGHIRHQLGDPQVLALTATAPEDVRDDIIKQLRLKDPAVIIRSLDRPNLTFEVYRANDLVEKRELLFKLLKGLSGSGIIYAPTRELTEQSSSWLAQAGYATAYYHAGLESETRTRVQDDFMTDRLQVITATCAFGMGIDKANVRFIIHMSIPGSLEAYYQEAGRAGRDGQPARCILLYAAKDQWIRSRLLTLEMPAFDEVQSIYRVLQTARVEDTAVISREELTGAAKVSDVKLEVALKELDRVHLVERLPNSARTIFVRTYVGEDELLRWQGSPAWAAAFWQRAGSTAQIDLLEMSTQLRLAPGEIEDYLWELYFDGLIDTQTSEVGYTVQFSERYLESKWERLQFQTLARLKERRFQKLAAMVEYATSAACRKRFMLGYLDGEEVEEPCGGCDICAERSKPGAGHATRLDFTATPAYELLAGITRSGLSIGLAKWILVLAGSKSQNIANLPARRMKLFGRFDQVPRTALRQAMDLFISAGILRQTVGEYPVIEVTEQGLQAVVRGLPQNLDAALQEINRSLQSDQGASEDEAEPEKAARNRPPKTVLSKYDAVFTELLVLRLISSRPNRMGRTLVVQILAGSESAKTERSSLRALPQFGALSGQSRTRIMETIDALIEKELLLKSDGGYPVLSVSERGAARIKTLEQVTGEIMQRESKGSVEAPPAETGGRRDARTSSHEPLPVHDDMPPDNEYDAGDDESDLDLIDDPLVFERVAESVPSKIKNRNGESAEMRPRARPGAELQSAEAVVPVSSVDPLVAATRGAPQQQKKRVRTVLPGEEPEDFPEVESPLPEIGAASSEMVAPLRNMTAPATTQPAEKLPRVTEMTPTQDDSPEAASEGLPAGWPEALHALFQPELPPQVLKHLLLLAGHTGHSQLETLIKRYLSHPLPVIRMAAQEALLAWSRRRQHGRL